jgi:hypothetical protein
MYFILSLKTPAALIIYIKMTEEDMLSGEVYQRLVIFFPVIL